MSQFLNPFNEQGSYLFEDSYPTRSLHRRTTLPSRRRHRSTDHLHSAEHVLHGIASLDPRFRSAEKGARFLEKHHKVLKGVYKHRKGIKKAVKKVGGLVNNLSKS
jgi:hypothetical protein